MRLRRGRAQDAATTSPAPPAGSAAAALGKGRPRVRAALEQLADLRGESPDRTAEVLARNVLKSVPRSLEAYRLDFSTLDFEAAGFQGGHPWLRTTSGRTFHDYPATAKDGLMFALLRDQLPKGLTPDTFGVAANVVRRYVRGADNLPPGAQVAVDAGCYIGFKPMAYADKMGPGSQVVAVEMMPDNFALLQRNIDDNGLADRVATVHRGLSDQPGSVPVRRFRQQQATIAEVDELTDRFAPEGEVEVETLASVLDRTVGDRDVDFLNVQVNGHELAVLDGLGPWLPRVRSFSVTSPYSREGVRLRDQVLTWFADRGIATTTVGESSVRAQH